MKHLKYDENYRIVTFYTEDVHDYIPPDTVKITDEIWQQLLVDTEDYKIKTGLSFESEYSNFDDVAYLEPIIQYIDNPPTKEEIDFAEYVLFTEDRLALIESKLGVV